MSYQVIARKYRPQRFADVVGQEHVTQTLANAIRQNRIAHAYLFVGPRGTGKTTLARIFAKCLNCTGGPKVDFPDDDPRAKEIAEGRSLDVLEIDGASNRGIEEIRELRETVKYAPSTSKFKIYIIDEVHMLTKEAFNALLKTLEEPPEHVKFMFATTEPEKVLPTILSRCQRFDLRRIPTALIVQHLGYIAKQENVKIDEPALYAIARGAEGGMRDAESTLDQLISFCGGEIVENDVLSMFGLAARGQILAVAQAVLQGQADVALRELNSLSKNGKDLGRLLSDLLNYFRNLLLYQISRGDMGLLEVSEAEATALKEQSSAANTETLTRIMEVLTEAEARLRDAASKKIALEVTLLKAIQARSAVSLDSVLKKLQDLRGNAPPSSATPAAPSGAPAPLRPASAEPKLTAPATPAVPKTQEPALSVPAAKPSVSAVSPPIAAPAPTPAPASSPVIAESAPSSTHLKDLWANILEGVGKASPFARTYLIEGHPASFVKNIFTIGFDPQFSEHLGLIDNAKNRTLIQTKLKELGHENAHVKFIVVEAPADWVRPAASASATVPVTSASEKASSASGAESRKPKAPEPLALDKEDFKNDPLIKQALEIFKGTIVDVRM